MRTRILIHPAFLVAVAILAFNDHVLKVAAPSVLSGKLSDFAGVFAVALLVSVAVPRTVAAVAMTGVAFAALKLSPGVASFAEPFLGGTTLQDPTDLIALVVLWPAAVIARRVPRAPVRGRLRRLLLTTSVLAAFITMTATSCDRGEQDFFLVRGETVHLFHRASIFDGPTAISTDGGRTWELGSTGYRQDEPSKRELRAVEEAQRAAEMTCSASGLCFRVTSGSKVEERSPGEPWTTTFLFDEKERYHATLHEEGLDWPNPADFIPFGGGCGGDPVFGGTFSAVTVVDVGGVEHVIVGMGHQGVLHKVVGAEDWERTAVGDGRPVPLHEPSWLTGLKISLLLALAMTVTLLTFGYRRREASGGGWLLGGASLIALGAAAVSTPLMAARYPLAGASLAASAALLMVAVFFLAARWRTDPDERKRRSRMRGQ